LAAAVAVGVILWKRRRLPGCRAALFGWAFFIVALAPVLGFFDVYYFRYSYVADHFQYLACLGLISLAAGTGTAICQRAGPRGRDLGTLAAAIVLLVLGVSTWRQARIYQNMQTLWRDTLAKNPRCWMAHDNLGLALAQVGRVPEAVAHWEQALRINPHDAEAHNNLGRALAGTGKIEEAIAHFEQALRINPDLADAHNNLGITSAQTGKIEEAIAHFEQALRINPDYAKAHYNLGLVLGQTGRILEAIEHLQQALRINPDYAEARNALARLQARQ
jgi:tetratricopeptide (TPR) repeat protein